jgi:hypothetical protein
MAIDTANLNLQLQAVVQFISARTNQYRDFTAIHQELVNISLLLNSDQLPLQIFSSFSVLSEVLKNIFDTHPDLCQFYNTKTLDLPLNPIVTSASQSLVLTLTHNLMVGQPEAKYNLAANQNILIGRELQPQNSAKLIHVPLPMYKKVSGRHAEIKPVNNAPVQAWQICDLNSTNGTYINGQKIKGCQTLQLGDKVTLAYPSASEKTPKFIYEEQLSPPALDDPHPNSIDADLIFLIIYPNQALGIPERNLVDQISQASPYGFVIVADTSDVSPQDIPAVQINLASIQDWIKADYPALADSFEITELALRPFDSNTLLEPVSSSIHQQQLDKFITPFIELAKKQRSELQASRIRQKLEFQIQQIEKTLSSYEAVLRYEIQCTEASLGNHTLEHWRDQYNRSKKRVDEIKDDFFRDARTQFTRANHDFATEFIPDNLLQRVDSFVRETEPEVTRIDGQVCIQLRSSKGQELHALMISFCQSELTQWANQQWKQVCEEIDGQGLEGLFKQSYQQLDCLPEFQLTNPFNSPAKHLNHDHHFRLSFNEIETDSSYSESSGYSADSIAKIALLTASTAISAAMGSPYAVLQGVSTISALKGLVGASLSRPQQESLKLTQVVDSLKRSTCAHYRNIARYLLNRVAQDINSAIETEERRFRKSRDTADEQMRRYFMEIENISRSYKVRQEALAKDRAAFEQIQRLGG